MNKIKHFFRCCHEANLAILSMFHWFTFESLRSWFKEWGPVLLFAVAWIAYCVTGLFIGATIWKYLFPDDITGVMDGGLVGVGVFFILAMYGMVVREQCKKVPE